MSQPFVGEIILVGFTFAPNGWAFCDGSLLPIAVYETLFTLIGTTYGGDGDMTFAVPDLRGRVPIHQGTGSGSSYNVGDSGGVEQTSLSVSQLPAHTHTIDISSLTATARCKSAVSDQVTPVADVPAIESAAAFTDSTLTATSSTIRAVHITELRSRIDAMRTRFSLGTFTYADTTLTAGSTRILAQHILDLRSALAPVYPAAGLSPSPTYTDPNLAAGTGTTVKAVHLTELRNAVLAVPGGGGVVAPYSSAAPDANMSSGAILVSGSVTAAATGGVQPLGGSAVHDNRQPYLTLNYCISLFGVFPAQ